MGIIVTHKLLIVVHVHIHLLLHLHVVHSEHSHSMLIVMNNIVVLLELVEHWYLTHLS